MQPTSKISHRPESNFWYSNPTKSEPAPAGDRSRLALGGIQRFVDGAQYSPRCAAWRADFGSLS